MRNPSLRLLLCALSLAIWLTCLLLGLLPALASHIFLLIAIVLWPRRRHRDPVNGTTEAQGVEDLSQ